MWFNFHNCESLENFEISSKISNHKTILVNNYCTTASFVTLAEKVQIICEHMLFNTEGYHNWYSTSTSSKETFAEIASLQVQYSTFSLLNHIPVPNF